MAEPDIGGVGGMTTDGGIGGGILRAKSTINLDYDDIKGLVKEMDKLVSSIRNVKTAIDSLDEGKTKTALRNFSASLTGGGGGGSRGSSFGSGGGSGASNGGGATFNGVMAGAGLALTAASVLANTAANRKQSDLMSDVTDMRVTLASGKASFTMSDANRYIRTQLGPTSFGRDDMNQAAQLISGRYGVYGSQGQKASASSTAALSMITGQGGAVGANLVNDMNSPQVLNNMRRYAGVSTSQFASFTSFANSATKVAFNTTNPTASMLSNYRPGMPQYNNLMGLTGGNSALASAVVESQREKARYYANGGTQQWNDKTIANLINDDDMQKKVFGAKSLALANQRRIAGKAISDEMGADLSRSGMVKSEEYLYNIQQSTQGVSQQLTKYLGPIANAIGGMSGKLGGLGQIMSSIAMLSAGGGGAGAASLLSRAGSALGLTAEAAGGATALTTTGAVAAGAATVGLSALGGQFVDNMIGNPKDNKGFDTGNVARYTAIGAGIGTAIPIPVLSTAVGAGVGATAGVAREAYSWLTGGGDPLPNGDGDQSRGSGGGGPNLSLTDATNLLLSRNHGGSSGAVNNMAPDLRLKLGKLFAMNPKLSLTSGWRSMAQQKVLYERYKAGKGNKAAKPGASNHEYGLAADIGPRSEYGWLSKNARGMGLVRPMADEPWHWEPPGAKGLRGGTTAASGDETGSASEATSVAGNMFSSSVSRAMVGGARQTVPDAHAATLSGLSLSAIGAGTQIGGAGVDQETIPTGSGGALTINQVAAIAGRAGISQNQIPTAIAIAMAESSLNPRNHFAGPKDNSYGLWQINMLGAMGPERRKLYHMTSNDELYNPSKNAEAMFDISKHGKNWGQWSTYGDGTYKKFMGQVNEALSSGVGDPVATPVAAPAFGGSTSMSVRSGSRITNNFHVTVKNASDAEVMEFARKVQGVLGSQLASLDSARDGG